MAGNSRKTAVVRGASGDGDALPYEDLAAAMALASDAFIAFDDEERITFFSEGAERIFGYDREDVLHTRLERLLPAAHRASLDRPDPTAHSGAVRGAQPERTEVVGVRSDGSEFPAEIALAAAPASDRTFLLVLRDITAQAKAQARLLARQLQLSEAQRLAKVGGWQWDVASNRVEWSEELYRIYGLAPDDVELSFETYLERVLAEDRERARGEIERTLKTGEPFEFEERIRRGDGVERLLRSRGDIVRGEAGEPARLVGVCQDITEQRAAEDAERRLMTEAAARAAAERSEARMSFLADASAELASSLDFAQTLRTVAGMAVPTMADWAAVDVLVDGKLQRLAVEHADPEKVDLAHALEQRYPADPDSPHGVYRVMRTGSTEVVEDIPDSLLRTSAQDEEHLGMLRRLGLKSYLMVPLLGTKGVSGVITFVYAESGRRYTEGDQIIAEDLARRAAIAIETARLVSQLEEAHARLGRQAEELQNRAEEAEIQNQELRALAEELERLGKAKGAFVATVSHELRTPLNGIIGYADLLMHSAPETVPEPVMHKVDRIWRAAQHLLHLIEEILMFASLEDAQPRVLEGDVDVEKLVGELEGIIQPLAEQKGLAFRIETSVAPSALHTDAAKLRQILLNLMSNAVKFTDEGSVTLTIGGGDGECFFAVRDTGVGIGPADLASLFEPFWQADTSRRPGREGAGLGLAIAHRLADILGGELSLDSEPGRGSEFRLRLPG